MSYNVLSGNVSVPIGGRASLKGKFTGSFDGDGTELINVSHVTQDNPIAGAIPYFFGSPNVDGERNLQGNSDFAFNSGTKTFTTKTGSFSHIILTETEAAVANPNKYLALNNSGQMVLTSSAPSYATGPEGSLQFHSGATGLSGSDNLVYDFNNSVLTLTGTMNLSGTINANELNINVVNKTVINIDASGSTKFGDTNDDTHQFTGSVLINGPLVLNRKIVNTEFYSIQSVNHFLAVQTSTIASLSTLTLPSANTLRNGQSFVIKDEQGAAATHNIKINTNGSDTIDGQPEIYIESPYGAINLYTNGSNKFFIY